LQKYYCRRIEDENAAVRDSIELLSPGAWKFESAMRWANETLDRLLIDGRRGARLFNELAGSFA